MWRHGYLDEGSRPDSENLPIDFSLSLLQIFLNFYRRSVVGLNFDFLALNITGFMAYAAFNVGLFWSPTIYVREEEIALRQSLFNEMNLHTHTHTHSYTHTLSE